MKKPRSAEPDRGSGSGLKPGAGMPSGDGGLRLESWRRRSSMTVGLALLGHAGQDGTAQPASRGISSSEKVTPREASCRGPSR